MRGAFESLTRLCDAFEGRMWIVSKAGPTVQARTERWLAHHRFFETTGIDPSYTGEMSLPDGNVIPATGKAFDLEFAQTSKWAGDQLILISAFWDAALQRHQIGLA
jgi:hypothetical protein